uniref:Uncharacterized protein n=1 Tax=Anguilla anguilla TaxID=7936 RepID=A0A0E9PWN7_ANGAN
MGTNIPTLSLIQQVQKILSRYVWLG